MIEKIIFVYNCYSISYTTYTILYYSYYSYKIYNNVKKRIIKTKNIDNDWVEIL